MCFSLTDNDVTVYPFNDKYTLRFDLCRVGRLTGHQRDVISQHLDNLPINECFELCHEVRIKCANVYLFVESCLVLRDLLEVVGPYWLRFGIKPSSFELEIGPYRGSAADWQQVEAAIRTHVPPQSFRFVRIKSAFLVEEDQDRPAVDNVVLALMTHAFGGTGGTFHVYAPFLRHTFPHLSVNTVTAICQTADLHVQTYMDSSTDVRVPLLPQVLEQAGFRIPDGKLTITVADPQHSQEFHTSMVQLFANNQTLCKVTFSIDTLHGMGIDLSETLNVVAKSSITELALQGTPFNRPPFADYCRPLINRREVAKWKDLWGNNLRLASLKTVNIRNRQEDVVMNDSLPVYMKVVIMYVKLNAAGRGALLNDNGDLNNNASTQDWVAMLFEDGISEDLSCTFYLLTTNPVPYTGAYLLG